MTNQSTNGRRQVAVTGIGAITPLGLSTRETWAALTAGRSGIGTITRFDPTDCPVKIAGEVRGFDPTQAHYSLYPRGKDGGKITAAFNRKEMRKVGRFSHLGVAAGLQAYADSGLDTIRDTLQPERCGANIGVGLCGLPEIESMGEVLREGGFRKLSPFFILQAAPNILCGHLAILLNLRGPNYCISSACATGGHSLGEAFRTIQRGEADVMLAGGSEAALTPLSVGAFAQMRALSSRNDTPEAASRPFDRDHDGFVNSEGSVVLVLEEMEQARARDARIYAEMTGYGATAAAHHLSSLAPEGEGSLRAMHLATDDAGIAPDSIDYVSAHATSTPAGDAEEATAIATLLGEARKTANVSAVKSMTGHLLGGAGALGALAAVLTLHHGVIPPTINLENLDPECAATGLNFTPNTAIERRTKVALANAFGFGGTNASLVFAQP